MSNTRLNADCAASIANALEVNDTLKHLNMTNNPITTSGALAIIYAIKLNTSSVLETLDLSVIFAGFILQILSDVSLLICFSFGSRKYR